MIANTITFTNKNGDSVTFANSTHFRLIDGLDLSDLSATVNQSSSVKNGAIYQSTKIDTRDFDIEFLIYRDHEVQTWMEEKRHDLYKVFNPLKNPFRIDFTTKGGDDYYINAELTSTPSLPQDFDSSNTKWQKGLLQFTSSDPFIYEKNEMRTDIAIWMPNLEFPLELTSQGVEVGYRSQSLIVNAINNGSDDTGMNIQFKALSAVVNPKLLNIITYEELKLNFTMQPNDVIEISTYSGSRSATLIRGNERINVFGAIDLSSVFLQLRVGDNLFRYDATTGIDYLEVSIIHRNTLIGV